MIISDFVVERFAELSTIVLSMLFLYRTLNTKINWKKQVIIGLIFVCVRSAYYIMGFGGRPYFSIAAGLLYAHFVFCGKFRMHLMWGVIIVIEGIIDALIIGIYLLFPNTSGVLIESSGVDRMIFIIVTKTILLAVYYLITKNIDKSADAKWQDCFFLLLITIGCWVMLEVLFKCDAELPANMSQLLITIGSLVLAVIIVSVVVLYNRLTTNARKLAHSELQLCMVEMTKEHIGEVNEMYSRISTVHHDLHNHFSVISGYIKAKEYDDLEDYVANLADEDTILSGFVKHPVLDTLISTRAKIAKQENIQFTVNIELPEVLPISDVDLCILISNVLDNAFEANQEASQPHFIYLNTRIINSYWAVACQNATREKGNLRSLGNLKSTKRSTGVHGIGTKQIQEIAEKTGGFVTYKHENYEFSALALLKLSDASYITGKLPE